MARTSLPPGFRFHPTDVELLMYYLKRKIMGRKIRFEAISELNIYRFSPWDLPDKSCLKSKDLEWYFFCPRERKYSSGDRMRRGTETGFWKTTGNDRKIQYDERFVGAVKTLVFHEGNAPRGKRTDWVAYEYRLNDKNLTDSGVAQDGYVLYKVFKKPGPGPKNGVQYGAPFREEEWDDDDSDIGPSSAVITAPENQNSATSMSLVDPVPASGLSLVEGGPSVQPFPNKVLVDGLNNSVITDLIDPRSPPGCAMSGQGPSSARPSTDDITYFPNDVIDHLLSAIYEDGTSLPNEQEHLELGELGHRRGNPAAAHLDGNDPFNGLEDLGAWAELDGGVNFSCGEGQNMNNMIPQDGAAFLELDDLVTPLNFSGDSGGFEVPTGSSYMARNPDASEHVHSIALGQICYDVNFSSSATVSPRLRQFSVCPDSSGRHVDSTNVFPTGNAYGNMLSQVDTAGYDLHSFSYRQPEVSGDAAGDQERASDEVPYL